MNEYLEKLLSDTDKLIAALTALESSHKHFSTIKYKLNREAGKIADLVTSCRRSVTFMKDDPSMKAFYPLLDEYQELLKSYHNNVKVTGGLFSSDKYRIKRETLLALINELTAAKARLSTVTSAE